MEIENCHSAISFRSKPVKMMASARVSKETSAVHLSILLAILSEVTMVTVSGLQAGNFAGITINRHFRGDIFHNEGETLPVGNIIPILNIFHGMILLHYITLQKCPLKTII